ncbi:MAG: ribonuclease E/G, partial [Actinomycetota bacterium]
SLGLVQMTRKRVGQGLIEAFSTTCESCAGRGIHVHMEPVEKKKLDREMKPTAPSEEVEEEAQSSNQEQPTDDVVEIEAEKPKFGRRRRRASSSGVLTPKA